MAGAKLAVENGGGNPDSALLNPDFKGDIGDFDGEGAGAAGGGLGMGGGIGIWVGEGIKVNFCISILLL